MVLIRERRRELGLTQTDLAQAAGVTTSAVSQWEQSEADGTIKLATLDTALHAMGAQLVTLAAPTTPLLRPHWDQSVAARVPSHPDGPPGATLAARYGDRVAAIAGECFNLPLPLTDKQAWLLADGISVDTTLDVFDQAARVRDTYIQWLRRAHTDTQWEPGIALPDHRRIPAPNAPHDPQNILDWAFLGIRNGAPWLDAVRCAGVLLIRAGHPWPILPTLDGFREAWLAALGRLRSTGDADPLAELVVSVEERTI